MSDQHVSESLLSHSQQSAAQVVKPTAAIEVKGTTFTLTVLRILTDDLAAVEQQLTAKLAQAPKFFHNAPIVLDLLAVAKSDIEVQLLATLLRDNHIIPVGVCNASESQQQMANMLGLGVFKGDKNTRNAATSKPAAPPPKVEPEKPAPPVKPEPMRATKVVTQPVRSGQQIYARGTDLVLLGAVSPGAEVLSDGNIHVYAPLRGRALAGVKGDTNARIFCQCLDAELVSIAGNYRVIDKVQAEVQGKPAQVYLEKDRLMISPL